MKRYRSLSTILGVGLNVISGIFTVKLMWAFATSGMGKIIFAVFGVLMQATMACCAVFAVHCLFQNQATRAIPAAVVYAGLLLLSFCGTAGNLSTENARLNNAGVTDSLEFQTISGQIADIDTQAEYLRKEIDECRAKNIITRCVKPKSEELSALMAEKRELQTRLLTVKPAIAEDEIFRRLSEFLQISTDQTKSLVFLLYSILLDLGGAVLLVYGAGLLAFQTRDLWKEAELKTELERQRFMQEKERLLSSVENMEKMPVKKAIPERPEPEDPKPAPPAKPIPGFTPVIAKKHNPVGYLADVPEGSEKGFRNPSNFDLPEPVQKPSTVEPFRNPSTVEGFQTPSESGLKCVQTGSESEPSEHLPEGSKSDLVRYIRAAFAGRDKRGFLLGRNRIQEKIGLSVDQCNKIHSVLKKAGLIDVKNNKTYPKFSESEMINRIAGGMA